MKKIIKYSRTIFCQKLKSFAVFSFLLGMCGLGTLNAQVVDIEVKVPKIVAETEDSIVFQTTVSKTTFLRGDDILIDYLVTNRNKNAVYLVVEPSSQVFINEDYTLELLAPVKRPRDHITFDYDLIKILPQKTYKGKLLLSARYYLSHENYSFEIAEIQIGFSYLFNKPILDGCKETDFVRPCLTELYEKSKSLTIGNLVVEIKNK